MDDSLLTKCPHCKTLFRIQHDHLAVADGEVRCGVCFKVFNAQAEGIPYGEGGLDTPPQPETSRDEAAAMVGKLDFTGSDETQKAPGKETPKQEEIEQLVIKEESVEQIFAAPKVRVFNNPWLWGSLSVLAFTLLACQWFWFNMDRYSRIPQWRPWYETACQYLSCRVAEFVALNQIQTERLTVKSHPEFSNVLVVDLIIKNEAPLPQPLPALDLAFYDINGATLSGRLLDPTEYLDPSLRLPHMPVKTPIHLSFSIMDPGPDAVNYGVQLAAISNQ